MTPMGADQAPTHAQTGMPVVGVLVAKRRAREKLLATAARRFNLLASLRGSFATPIVIGRQRPTALAGPAVWWRNIPYFVSRGYYVITHDARFFGTSSSGDSAKQNFEGATDSHHNQPQ